MRVLIVHNQLWAHYKSRLFSDIDRVFSQEPDSELLVAQIGLYEASRSVMRSDDTIQYEYPYQLLFNKSLDEISTGERRKALFRVFTEFKPDVLNITGWGDMAQVQLMFFAKLKGVKVVISSESSSMDHQRSAWKEAFKSFIVTKANAFFCFGKTSVQYLESLGVNSKKIAVRNAAVIDEDVIRGNFENTRRELAGAGHGKRKFVYVGRLASEKNLPLLLNAFAKVMEVTGAASSWELLLVGDGPLRPELESQAAGSGVVFAGGHPWYEVPNWLAKSDVLILPSKSEPWGLVVNEAMVCGMPVIVSEKCGCVPDLVSDGQNGFVFDPEKQQELEKAMLYFVQNPDRISTMGAVSIEKIRPFSSENVAAEMVNTFKQLAKA